MRIHQAQRLVGSVRLCQGILQRGAVALEPVVADRQGALRIALVAQAAHAKRGGMGQIEGVLAQGLQAVGLAFHEIGTDRRRSAKQDQQQKGVPPEVADQPEMVFVRQARH